MVDLWVLKRCHQPVFVAQHDFRSEQHIAVAFRGPGPHPMLNRRGLIEQPCEGVITRSIVSIAGRFEHIDLGTDAAILDVVRRKSYHG